MPILKDSGIAKATDFLNACVNLLQAHVDGRFASVSLPSRVVSMMAPERRDAGSTSAAATSSPKSADGKLHLPKGGSFALPTAFAASRIDVDQTQWANPSAKILVQAIYWMTQVVENNDNCLLDSGDESGNTPPALVSEGFEFCFASFRNAMDARTETFFPVVSDELSREYTRLIVVFVGALDPVNDISSNVLSRIPGIPGGSVGGTVLGFLAKKLAQVSSTVAGKIDKVKQSAVNAMRLNMAVLDPSAHMAERTMQANLFIVKVKAAFDALNDCANKTTFSLADIEQLNTNCDFAADVIGGKPASEVTRADIAEIYRRTAQWVTDNMATEVSGVYNKRSFMARLCQLQMTLLSSGHETAEVAALTAEDFVQDEQAAEEKWVALFQLDRQLRVDLADTGVAFGDSMQASHLANMNGAAVAGRLDDIVRVADQVTASFAASAVRKSVTDGVVEYERDNGKGALADRLIAAFTYLKANSNSKAALQFAYAELLDVHLQLKHLLGHSAGYKDYPASNTFATFGIHLTAAFELITPLIDSMDASNDGELAAKLVSMPSVVARPLVEPAAEAAPATPIDASSVSASSGSDGDTPPPASPVAAVLSRLGVTNTAHAATGCALSPAAAADDEDEDFVMVQSF
ncbi:MAG: hypothetical protein P1U40_07625 [Coxiellaceae bacterium]|nr:hypothetical protein [Coxiellaceae bacterium]